MAQWVKMWKRDMLRTKKTNVIVFEQYVQISTATSLKIFYHNLFEKVYV